LRQIEVPINTLLPVQDAGVWQSGVQLYMNKFADDEEVPPIDVIALPDMPEHHILLHGHHRGRAAYQLGRSTIAANLTESDADIQLDAWSEMRWFYPSLRTVDDIFNEYHSCWLPKVRAAGFSGLHDIPYMPEGGNIAPGRPPGQYGRMSFQEMVKWNRGY
jgi:hypothetical protein